MAPSRSRRSTTASYPQRGEIYLVNFDPTVGHEIQKTRPALIIQNDISNRYSPITIVAPITSKFEEPPYPTDVIIEPAESGLPQRSAVVLNQIRAVDRRRLGKRLGKLGTATLQNVNHALQISLGLIAL